MTAHLHGVQESHEPVAEGADGCFLVKYDNVKLLLESSSKLLEMIFDIQQKLRRQSAFLLPYIEA